jgi:malonate-semialdehyde dehydrogenase (acetylating)/methylmalonate-semialdehyde dehydrogenase
MTKRITHWIDGKPAGGVAERSGEVFDPATGAVSARVDYASRSDVDDAVAAAERAFQGWRHSSLATRSRVLDPSHGGINLGFPQND